MKFGNTTIGGMSFGSTKIGGAKYGNTLVFQPGGQPQPTMIPYIRGGADGSYIDTGIVPDNNTRVIVWARNFNPPIASHMLFGYIDSGANTNSFGIGAWGAASCGRIGVYFANYTNPYTIFENAWTCLGGYHKYELDGKVLKIDDEVKVTSTSTDTITTAHSMHLFGRSTGGTHTAMTLPADICACKIYKNGTLVRDYTAVNSPSVGLYDAVSDTVFTNAGSGSFTYGTFDQNAYTPLEYVGCSGAQYFDSGIRGSNSLNYVVKFRNGGTSAWPNLFLAQTSNSSKRYGLAFGDNTTPNSVVFFTFNNTNKNYAYGGSFAGKDLIALKSGVEHYLYENNTQKTKQTHTAATFTTDYNIFVGAGNNAGSVSYNYTGRIYYLGFLSSRNFVPAKVNNVAGMYDTYNDMFYPSASSTPFTAGPTI